MVYTYFSNYLPRRGKYQTMHALPVGASIYETRDFFSHFRRLREERKSSPSARRSSPPEIQTSTLEKAVTFSPPKSPKKSPKSPKSILKKTNNTSDKSKKSHKNNKSDKSQKPEKNTDNNKEGVNPEGIVQERILGFDNAAYYNY